MAGTERTITQALKVTGAGAMGAFAGFVNGKHAAMSEDLRIVLSVGANTLWASRLVQSGNSVDKSIASYLKENGLSWMTRADIDTNTAANDYGAYVGLGRGIEGAAVAAMWSEGQLIRDIYSDAAKGEVSDLPLVVLGFCRTTGFFVRPCEICRLMEDVLERRAFGLELRAAGRVLAGLAVPWGRTETCAT